MDTLTKDEQLNELKTIRLLMERSSKFLSLSGLSGVIAGILAMLGAGLAYSRINYYRSDEGPVALEAVSTLRWELIIIALCTLCCTLLSGSYFTWKESKKQQQKVWNKSSKQLLYNLSVPLVAGGIFCFILIYKGQIWLATAATLVFYGLALVNASIYTLNEVRYLGYIQIVLGLFNCFWPDAGSGLLFWTIGFGPMHIIYGIYMHFKYNNKPFDKQ